MQGKLTSGISAVLAVNSLSATVTTNQQNLPRYATTRKNQNRFVSAAVNTLAANPCVTVLTISFEQLYVYCVVVAATVVTHRIGTVLDLAVNRRLIA